MPERNAIPIVDFGGEGPSLHFAHANAYPPQCYRQYLQPLARDYRVWAMEQRPLWPGANAAHLNSWHPLASDFLQALAQRGDGQVIAVGHSLGAVVSMMAAVQRPDLFRALLLIEPVLLPPAILQLARDHPQQAQNTPLVQLALSRRQQWASRQQAFDHFRSKAVFRLLPDEALWDYVNYGLTQSDHGHVVLRFPAEWEARIYSHPPLDIWELLPQITAPTLAIRGQHSDTIAPESWQRWQQLQPRAEFVQVGDAGHLLPFERPDALSRLTRAFLARLPT